MPPKAKFTRDDIIKAALDIVREENMESLTARALGRKLGSSACPIFTVFNSMEEVQQAVIKSVKDIYKRYVEKGLSEKPAFKGVGTQYILFALNEPKLFQILFMSEKTELPDINNVLPVIDENYGRILESITSEYGIEVKEAERLYKHLWIYTHGIASLCATNMCRFKDFEISEMMTDVFTGMLNKIKGEKKYD